MRLRSTSSSGKVMVDACFGDEESADLMALTLDPDTGSGEARLHSDVGLPVRQPTRIVLNVEGATLALLREEARVHPPGLTAIEALAIAVYAHAAGKILRSTCTARDDGAQLLAELDGRRTGARSDAPISAHLDDLHLPDDYSVYVSDAHDSLLVMSGDRLHVGDTVAIALSDDISALDSPDDINRIRGTLDLPLVPCSCSIAAAGTALTAIAWPGAAAVSFFADSEHPAHSWRLQAAASFPLLAARIAETPSWRAAVDTGAPLADLIAERTALPRPKLKRFARLTRPLPQDRLFATGEIARGDDATGIDRQRRYAVGADLTLDAALDLFRDMEISHLPRTDQDWQDMADIASAAALPLKAAFDLSPVDILTASRGNWSRFRTSLAQAADLEPTTFDRRQIALTTIDVLEAVDDFCNTVILAHKMADDPDPPAPTPSYLQTARRHACAVLLGASRNPAAHLFSLTRRWLARIPALIDAEMSASSGHPVSTPDSWPALTDNYCASSGHQIVNLTSVDALKDESRRMRNCVGRLYLRPAMRGACHIFSVRDESGQISHSTFEVEPPPDAADTTWRDLRILQHKGFRNGKPPKLAIAACNEWLQSIAAAEVTVNVPTVNAWRHDMATHLDDAHATHEHRSAWTVQIGPALESQEIRDRLWTEWRTNILRKSDSRTRPDSVLAAPLAPDMHH